AGLFGLVGLAGAFAAPAVGRLSDRRGPRFASGVALGVALVAFAVLGLLGRHLVALVAGVLLLDAGVNSAHVSNLARIHALDPARRSRRNTVYMVAYFAGGALGTWLGVRAWTRFGWTGVSVAGAGFVLLAIAAWARTGGGTTAAPPRSPAAAPPR
ncbi:MAG TPA: MFS transporter, partial [Anaeromyxobacteraceae bacterium]|nr:MFS transporter [Anaeromyxobacteraceae bacterium]